MTAAPADAHGQSDPYAVFRPSRGRRVAAVMSALSVVLFTGGALSMPWGDSQLGGWSVSDRLPLIACGLVIAVALRRFATIRAVPSTRGLIIRNLMTTRDVEWSQIVSVQFGGGAPWVSVDLDDTDTVAVMAIQRADGFFGQAEAARLSALVQVHSGTSPTG